MRLALLSGGVGGARLARGLAAHPRVELTVVVNVGDDDCIHGLRVSPDLDTVVYTLAGLEGEGGWGRAGDTWTVMSELGRFPVDTSFRLGDLDLALNLFRSGRLAAGAPLSMVTAEAAAAFGLSCTVLPASDQPVRTQVETEQGWLDFQTYFVTRAHRDPVRSVRFVGAERAAPAPGVLEALGDAEAVVIGPSNPVLSVWPILAVSGIEDALAGRRVMAVSPLIGGRAVKGPTVEVMSGLGMEASPSGVVSAYRGLVTDLVVDREDPMPTIDGVRVWAADTRIVRPEASRRLAEEMVSWLF